MTDSPPSSNELARRALFGFLLTFIGARIMVLLIMSRRVPNLYFFMRGTHVHHLNYGIFLLTAVAGYLLFAAPSARALRRCALIYGAALALTFDEFGMWLHLGGSYWQRGSVDAVVVVAALLAMLAYAPSWRRLESRHVVVFIIAVLATILFGVVLYDTSLKVGKLEGPRLRELELSSSP